MDSYRISDIIRHKHVQYAPVCPLPVAQELRRRDLLGRYHLLLAHDVAANPQGYADVYRNPKNFIIMDNSAAELEGPVDLDMLLAAGFAVNADCLVLPDHLLQSEATFEAHMKAIEYLSSRWPRYFMALPQGETFEHWVACAGLLLKRMPDRVRYFGVPRNVKQKLGVSRTLAITILNTLDHDGLRRYHLFGCSDSMMDDVLTAQLKYTSIPRIMGIDSAVPVRMGYNGVGLHLLQTDPGPRGDWWERPGEYCPMVEDNILAIRHWIKGGNL